MLPDVGYITRETRRHKVAVAKRTFKSLLADVIGVVTTSPVPVRSVEYDPATKRIRVEFDRPAAAAPAETATAAPAGPLAGRIEAEAPRFIPGTDIPDDNSPIDAMALAGARPRYDLDASNGVNHGDRG